MNRNPKIGFMQGRLLPKYKGIYQCHPKEWMEEFELAHKFKYDYVEWIVDEKSKKFNDLLTEVGRNKIKKNSEKYQVHVNSICADILLENPIGSSIEEETWKQTLIFIINAAYQLKCKILVVPLIESMSIRNKNLYKIILNIFNELKTYCEDKGIKIAFELDLKPNEVKFFMKQLNSKIFGINYDSGNSAACGFEISNEFKAYKSHIINFHIKDRFYMGSSTLLGTGNTDLNFLAKQLSLNFKEYPIILQAYRDEAGLEITNKQRDWFLNLLKENISRK